MKLSDLVPARNERAMIVGQTGSGKTVLARYLLAYRRNIIVFDPKRRIDWQGFTLVTSLKALVHAKAPRIVYRPSHDAIKGWGGADDEIENAFEFVYRRGNTTLYVDEAYLVTRGEEMPRFYHACLTQGRELGVETWSATQRPMHIPQVLGSEAEHMYVFRLKMPQDRKKVESMSGIAADLMAPLALRKYRFYYATQEDEAIGPLKLDLRSAAVAK